MDKFGFNTFDKEEINLKNKRTALEKEKDTQVEKEVNWEHSSDTQKEELRDIQDVLDEIDELEPETVEEQLDVAVGKLEKHLSDKIDNVKYIANDLMYEDDGSIRKLWNWAFVLALAIGLATHEIVILICFPLLLIGLNNEPDEYTMNKLNTNCNILVSVLILRVILTIATMLMTKAHDIAVNVSELAAVLIWFTVVGTNILYRLVFIFLLLYCKGLEKWFMCFKLGSKVSGKMVDLLIKIKNKVS